MHFFRISVIFRVKSAKAIKITDMDLIKRLGIIIGIFVLCLLIRTLVSPPIVIVGKKKNFFLLDKRILQYLFFLEALLFFTKCKLVCKRLCLFSVGRTRLAWKMNLVEWCYCLQVSNTTALVSLHTLWLESVHIPIVAKLLLKGCENLLAQVYGKYFLV